MSLRATHLSEVALNAASLVDVSIPIIDFAALAEDIKSAYTADPVAIQELDRCLNGNPSLRFSISPSGLLIFDRRVYVPDHRPDRGNLRTRVLHAEGGVSGLDVFYESGGVDEGNGGLLGTRRSVRLRISEWRVAM